MTLTTYFKDKAPRTNASSAWLERTNPLKGLSLREAQNIYDLAKNGNFCQLHYIYNEIEAANPVLLTCVERRSSALAGLGWKTSASAHATDSELAEKQKRAIAQLAESLDNLDETIEHLALAFFRGFSHVRVVRQADGTPTGFDLLNSWNFAFDKVERQWYWNPNCRLTIPGAGSDMEAVPAGELLTVMRPRAIDYPALAVHIRHALAERDWGRFLERYGIPPVYAIMPQGASEKDRDLFLEGIGKMQNGRGTALPSGSDVKFAQEARGVNPFLEFIQHQEKTIVLLATGGTLTSLAEAGSGTLAGNAQMDVWEQIVGRDGVMIGNALDRTIFRPYLQALFPGQPIVAHFELGKETEASPSEILEMGAKAKTAGYRIAKATLEEKTGYTLEEDTPAAQPGFPALNAALNASMRGYPPTEGSREAGSMRGGNDEAIHKKNETKEEPADTDSMSVLQAFAKDATPAAQAVKAIIDNPNPAEAEKLLKNLPDLLPRDPAMAAVIAEEMAKAFQVAPDAALNREYKRARDGKFSEVDEPRDLNPGINPDDSTVQAAQIGKGKKALAKCLAEKCDIHDAVMRSDIGGISFRFGDEKSGIKHFFDRKEALAKLPETLIRGEAGKPYQGGQKLNITHGGFVATLALTNDPTKGERPPTWVLTSFGPKDKKEGTPK